MDLTVEIGNKVLTNPVGVASGTFGYGSEYEKLIDLDRLGALFTKAVTLEPRPGNEMPRIIETPSGMLNSIGLANVGSKRFIEEKIPYLSQLQCAVVANVSGSKPDDYENLLSFLEDNCDLWGYEINISCPNVKEGGIAFGTDCGMVDSLTSSLRKRTKKPLVIKLTPNVTDIASIASSAEAGGADAVSCINTVVGMAIDIHQKRPVIPAGTAGLSGPAIKPVGIAAVYRVAKKVKIPVIGIGGIMSAEDAVEYLLAGASAVQVGTATFVDPSVPVKVLEGIEAYMKVQKLRSITHFHSFSADW